MIPAIIIPATNAPAAVGLGVLLTGFFLGIRHGIDWDHIAAITDITSTTAAAGLAEAAHEGQHLTASGHAHSHGGALELRAHDSGPGAATLAPSMAVRPGLERTRFVSEQAQAIRLGTLYALGHGAGGRRPGPARAGVRRAPARVAGSDHGPDRRLHPRRPRPVGHLLDLPVCPCRRVVPPAQPVDARLRRRPLRLAPVPGPAPRPRARRAARDELVWSAHRVRRRDDPRDRRRDGQPGPADRRGRRRLERRSRRADARGVRGRAAGLELRDRRRSARSASSRARPASASTSRSAAWPASSALSSARSSCSG